MTSYQNISESQIDGYNDCPIVDHLLTSKRVVSGSSNRRKRLVGHDLNSNTTSRSTSPSSIPKMLTPDSIASPNPMRKFRISSTVDSNSVNPSGDATKADQIDDLLITEIDSLLSRDSNLPEREFKHYSTKINNNKDSILKLSTSDKLSILNSINDEFNKVTKSKLMALILNNEGLGTWCLPLIKLLENLKTDENKQ